MNLDNSFYFYFPFSLSDTCVNTIIPLVCKFCQQAIQNEDPTLPSVARQLGRLLHGLSSKLKFFTPNSVIVDVVLFMV